MYAVFSPILFFTMLFQTLRSTDRLYIYIPGTQMTLVLIGKDLVLEGSTTKIEGSKQVPGIYVYICVYIYMPIQLHLYTQFHLLRMENSKLVPDLITYNTASLGEVTKSTFRNRWIPSAPFDPSDFVYFGQVFRVFSYLLKRYDWSTREYIDALSWRISNCICVPRKVQVDQTSLLGSIVNPLEGVILKTILCLVLDSQGIQRVVFEP